jgi:hypothetical protein
MIAMHSAGSSATGPAGTGIKNLFVKDGQVFTSHGAGGLDHLSAILEVLKEMIKSNLKALM